MSHLILSHLSKNNNKPELVSELFNKNAGDTNIIIASRYEETEVFNISSSVKPGKKNRLKKSSGQQQLSLF
jgi:hypothetical protein